MKAVVLVLLACIFGFLLVDYQVKVSDTLVYHRRDAALAKVSAKPADAAAQLEAAEAFDGLPGAADPLARLRYDANPEPLSRAFQGMRPPVPPGWLAGRAQLLALLTAALTLAALWPARRPTRAPAAARAVPAATKSREIPVYTEPVLRALTNLMIVVSPEGNILSVNGPACDALGYTEGELLGRPYESILAKSDDPLTMVSHRNLEATYRTKDGRLIPVTISCSLVAPDGPLQGMVTLAQDISERKEAAANLESREARLRVLMDKLVGAQEEERRTIARDLHDGMLQYVVAAELQLRREPESPALQKAREHLKAAVDEGRRLIYNLRPAALDQLGLVPALRNLLDDDDWQAECQLDIEGLKLSPALETTVYRIVQEAVTNARKHGQASKVTLKVRLHEGYVELQFRDDGKGFQPNGTTKGVGLESMRERAEQVGGWLRLESEPGKGAVLRARLPISGVPS